MPVITTVDQCGNRSRSIADKGILQPFIFISSFCYALDIVHHIGRAGVDRLVRRYQHRHGIDRADHLRQQIAVEMMIGLHIVALQFLQPSRCRKIFQISWCCTQIPDVV